MQRIYNKQEIRFTLDDGEASIARDALAVVRALHNGAVNRLALKPDDGYQARKVEETESWLRALTDLPLTESGPVVADPTTLRVAVTGMGKAVLAQIDLWEIDSCKATGQTVIGSGVLDGIDPSTIPVSTLLFESGSNAPSPATELALALDNLAHLAEQVDQIQ